ncbi:MAG: holo-ACP synthase [Thermodesulfobacteriota bacterium]
MLYGVGVDLIEIARIERAWRRWGRRFEEKIYDPSEVEFCRPRGRPAACLALRFAAKEAFSKAVGLGLRTTELLWRDIVVSHDPRGKPYFILKGTAARVAGEIGLRAAHLSLTDEAGLAQALVAVEVADR